MQKEMFEIPKEEGLVESCQVNVGMYDGSSKKRGRVVEKLHSFVVA